MTLARPSSSPREHRSEATGCTCNSGKLLLTSPPMVSPPSFGQRAATPARRCRCWMSSFLAALLVSARTHAPASAFVLNAPRHSDFSPSTSTSSPLPRRAAGLCDLRPPGGAFFSRRFLANGGSHRECNAAFRAAVQDGGGLRMGYRDRGKRRHRCRNPGSGLASPHLAQALPVRPPRGARVRVSGGRSYGEINGSRDTNDVNSRNSNNGSSSNSSSSSGGSNSTGGEVRSGSRGSPAEEPLRKSPDAFGAEQR